MYWGLRGGGHGELLNIPLAYFLFKVSFPSSMCGRGERRGIEEDGLKIPFPLLYPQVPSSYPSYCHLVSLWGGEGGELGGERGLNIPFPYSLFLALVPSLVSRGGEGVV